MINRFPRGPKPTQVAVSEKQEKFLTQIASGRQSAKNLSTRASIILQCREYGRRNQQIADDLGVNYQMVRFWRKRWLDGYDQLIAQETEEKNHDYKQILIEFLSDRPRSGVPPTFTPEQVCQIIALSCELPSLSDRPISHWTPRELADEAIKRGIVETISATQVRSFLKRGRSQAA